MSENGRSFGVTDIAAVIVGAVFTAGLIFVFHACEPMEDGAFMTCHWAERATEAVAAAALALAVIKLVIRDRGIKTGLDISLCVLAAVSALIPGVLIPLCMMPDMRCRSVMRPAVTVCAVLLFAAALADILVSRRRGAK